MPLVLIAGAAAGRSDEDQENWSGLVQSAGDANITCLFSFLSADQSTMYHVCEVDSVAAAKDAAQRSHASAKVMMEVSEILPGNLADGTLQSIFPGILYNFR